MNNSMLPPGLSSASGKPVVVEFDGGLLWSDGGVLVLREVEERLRVIARVEAGAERPDTRFVVTNLGKPNARRLYEDVYCRRGQAENHIKS